MSDVEDDELILFHYRDGLPAMRLMQIERALAASASLRGRYDELCAALAAVDGESHPEPARDFEERLWRRIQPRIGDSAAAMSRVDSSQVLTPKRSSGRRLGGRDAWSRRVGFAATAAAVLLMVGALVFQAAHHEPTQPAVARNAATADAMAKRMLAVKITEHLRATEVVLLSMMNAEDHDLSGAHSQALALLVESNPLYTAAAARSGDRALAGFLRSLQSILIELANQSAAGGIQTREGLQQFLSSADLLFQVRAVEARLRAGPMDA